MPDGANSRTKRVLAAIAIGVAAIAIIAVAAIRASEQPSPVELEQATVDYVIDGDTIDVLVDGKEMRIRLIGIDCPESASHDEALNTEEGAEATAFVRQLLPQGTTVFLQSDEEDMDKYGRHLRYVWVEAPQNAHDAGEVAAKMANSLIIEAGYADTLRYWPNTAYEEQFEGAKQRALAADAGVSHLWAA